MSRLRGEALVGERTHNVAERGNRTLERIRIQRARLSTEQRTLEQRNAKGERLRPRGIGLVADRMHKSGQGADHDPDFFTGSRLGSLGDVEDAGPHALRSLSTGIRALGEIKERPQARGKRLFTALARQPFLKCLARGGRRQRSCRHRAADGARRIRAHLGRWPIDE